MAAWIPNPRAVAECRPAGFLHAWDLRGRHGSVVPGVIVICGPGQGTAPQSPCPAQPSAPHGRESGSYSLGGRREFVIIYARFIPICTLTLAVSTSIPTPSSPLSCSSRLGVGVIFRKLRFALEDDELRPPLSSWDLDWHPAHLKHVTRFDVALLTRCPTPT